MTLLLTDEPAADFDSFARLLDLGKKRKVETEELRTELSERVANYIATVRNAKKLPPHALPAGFFFTEQFPVVDTIRSELQHDEGFLPRAPLAPVTTILKDPKRVRIQDQTLPDPGRHIQLWPWDTLGGKETRGGALFERRAEWLGEVQSVDDDGFSARLWDRAHPGTIERRRFPILVVSRDDRALLRPGARFYWTLGYLETTDGEREACSRVRLQRLPDRHGSRDVRRDDRRAAKAIIAGLRTRAHKA